MLTDLSMSVGQERYCMRTLKFSKLQIFQFGYTTYYMIKAASCLTVGSTLRKASTHQDLLSPLNTAAHPLLEIGNSLCKIHQQGCIELFVAAISAKIHRLQSLLRHRLDQTLHITIS